MSVRFVRWCLVLSLIGLVACGEEPGSEGAAPECRLTGACPSALPTGFICRAQPATSRVVLLGPSINLTGTNLRNADLTGANLSSATLTAVTWLNTTCPDGTNSDNNGNTCLGHL